MRRVLLLPLLLLAGCGGPSEEERQAVIDRVRTAQAAVVAKDAAALCETLSDDGRTQLAIAAAAGKLPTGQAPPDLAPTVGLAQCTSLASRGLGSVDEATIALAKGAIVELGAVESDRASALVRLEQDGEPIRLELTAFQGQWYINSVELPE